MTSTFESHSGRVLFEDERFLVRRIPVPPEPLLDDKNHDYADTFEVELVAPDSHSAEHWVRAALSNAPLVRRLVRIVHSRLAKFRLNESLDALDVLGWEVRRSEPDILHLEASGPALDAAIVARRTSPTSVMLTTFLFYKLSSTARLWLVLGPVHRRVALHLLRRAAVAMTSERN
jgi:hypothetical protein